ncbi:hypothetical protein [Kitasatospora griseola]
MLVTRRQREQTGSKRHACLLHRDRPKHLRIGVAMTDTTTDTRAGTPWDLKADPPPVRIGTHVLFRVGPDETHPEQRVVLVYKDTLNPPRWGLPGGSWGAYPDETPADTAARHLSVRLGVRPDSYPTVIGVDWVPAGQYPPGVNLVFDGGVITSDEAAMMRPMPGSAYGELRLVPIGKILDAGLTDAEALRINQAVRVVLAGRGMTMTEAGIPLPALPR